MLNFFSKIKKALTKTSSFLSSRISDLLKGKIDEETLDELNRILFEADLGASLADLIVDKVREAVKKNPNISKDDLMKIMKIELINELKHNDNEIKLSGQGPTCLLIVGINGSGKTTSAAKLANFFRMQGKSVLLVAADTFRAAATTQLETWAKRINVDIVKGQMGSDPAAVVFDAMNAAVARGTDIVIIDTAGRLHVKTDLMNELQKIRRVCTKIIPEAPHETLLVLDSTIGQNAIDQAKTFNKFTPLSGIILTKLDGTTKGGASVAIQKECHIPIKFIGVGEGVDDLQPFEKESFAEAILP
jgi:fused signal recognition particle receptor